VKFGAVLPTNEIGNDPIVIRDYAQTAEGLGYSHLLLYDHVIGAEHRDREPDPGFTTPHEHIAALERFIEELRSDT
jgi:hypothetical protein